MLVLFFHTHAPPAITYVHCGGEACDADDASRRLSVTAQRRSRWWTRRCAAARASTQHIHAGRKLAPHRGPWPRPRSLLSQKVDPRCAVSLRRRGGNDDAHTALPCTGARTRKQRRSVPRVPATLARGVHTYAGCVIVRGVAAPPKRRGGLEETRSAKPPAHSTPPRGLPRVMQAGGGGGSPSVSSWHPHPPGPRAVLAPRGRSPSGGTRLSVLRLFERRCRSTDTRGRTLCESRAARARPLLTKPPFQARCAQQDVWTNPLVRRINSGRLLWPCVCRNAERSRRRTAGGTAGQSSRPRSGSSFPPIRRSERGL